MVTMSSLPPETIARPTRVLDALQHVARQVAVTADLATILATAVETIHSALGYEQVAVHLTHPETGQLTLCAVAGLAPAKIPSTHYYLSLADTTPGQAAGSGQVIHHPDLLQHPNLQPALGQVNIQAELSVPIWMEAHVIGALTAGSSHRGPFEAEDETYLALFAEQMAAALRGARLIEHAAAREVRETLLANISHAINSSLDPGQVLAQTVAVVGEQLKVDRCTLGQINLRSQTLVTEHEYVNPLLFERRSLKRPTQITEALSQVVRRLRAGSVIISTEQTPDALPADYWGQLSQRYGVHSLVWVPIPSQSQEAFYTLQLLQVTYTRRWSDEDVVLLGRLADQLGIALRNAELFDDTQRSAAALTAKNTELETFVYTVSHDLQAAVASLSGFATLLQTRYQNQLDERGNMYVGRIAVNAEYLGQMLRHLLELSRVGRVEEPDDMVSAGAIVEEALNDLARPLAERDIVLEVPGGWPLVRYSRIRLREVFSNLLSNAIKFMGDQPKPLIEIGWQRLRAEAAAPGAARGAPPGDHLIEFHVKDNGVGIDSSDQQRIFLPFQRLEKLNVEGTGVGLSIVKRIVEGRGGSIRIVSQAGQGATFFFTVPAVAENDELTPLGVEAPPA